MPRPGNSRNGFIRVFAIAAIALVFAGTMVVSSEKPDPARSTPNAETQPADGQPILWNVG
jgi:hypothetical protein